MQTKEALQMISSRFPTVEKPSIGARGFLALRRPRSRRAFRVAVIDVETSGFLVEIHSGSPPKD